MEVQSDSTDGSYVDLLAEHLVAPVAVLDAELRRLEVQRREIEARMAAVVTAVERSAAFAVDGHRSISAYLRATLNCSSGQARRLRDRARAAADLAGLGDVWMNGHVGGDQVDELARRRSNPRCGHRLGESMPVLLDHAEHLEFHDFRTVMTRWEALADPDGAFDDTEAALRDRDASVVATDTGVDIAAHGGCALDGVKMRAIFDRFVDAEFRADSDARTSSADPLPRTAAQRRADALRELFHAADTAADHRLVGSGPAVCVNIVVDAATFGDTLHTHGLTDTPDPFRVGEVSLLDRRCTTNDGIGIHPDTALAAALTGTVRRVVLDSRSVVVDQGVKQRLFTGAARDAALLLATTCSHPGCTVPARFCQIDHMTPWSHGGRTDQINATPTCDWHNKNRHHSALRARRTTNGQVHPIRPDGTPMLAAGQRPPPWADTDP